MAILLISSDLPEMVTLADRIAVMREFAIVGELDNDHDYDRMSRSVIRFIHDGQGVVRVRATDQVTVGRTDVAVTRLGLGLAPIGGLFTAVGDEVAHATVEAAWDLGLRYFDTAPLYGCGLSERRAGAVLAGKPRGEFTLSTKVGRLLVPGGGDGQGFWPSRPTWRRGSTSPPPGCAARTRRAWPGWGWTGSTSRTSTTRTTTSPRRRRRRTRSWRGCAMPVRSARSAPG